MGSLTLVAFVYGPFYAVMEASTTAVPDASRYNLLMHGSPLRRFE